MSMPEPSWGPSPWLQLILVIVIALVLLWPMAAITGLIEERAARAVEAVDEIGSSWGGAQSLAGPALGLAIDRPVVRPDSASDVGDSEGAAGSDEPTMKRRWVHLLPAELDVDAALEPIERSRGGFVARLYETKLAVTARYDVDRVRLRPDETIDWTAARVAVGLAEPRGLVEAPQLSWNGVALDAEPTHFEGFGPALSAPIGPALPDSPVRSADDDATEPQLRFVATLRGSRALTFLPTAAETRVAVRSPWPEPSFSGAFLPRQHEIGADGFVARWSVSRFAHTIPLTWHSANLPKSLREALAASRFGVRLTETAGFYQQVTRCTKYAVLFIGLVFGLVGLLDLIGGLRLHPVPYALVGLALAIFFLLLLALAEKIGFSAAYAAAAGATTLLIGSYARAILGGLRRAAALALPIAGLFALLFVLVRLETYALLVGALALFLSLAAVMWLTRNLDWQRVLPIRRSRRPEPRAPETDSFGSGDHPLPTL
ncbi:MAG: cell envelope integrity protein CreD [Acidobacteriota bacterium]